MLPTVRADVVDITTDPAKSSDRFVVDTNVWLFVAYAHLGSGAGKKNPSKVSLYSNYLHKALSAGAQVRHCALTLAEVAHVIEKTEYEIHRKSGGGLDKKPWRHSPTERAATMQEVRVAWQTIESLGQPFEINLTPAFIATVVTRLNHCSMDAYDAMLVEGSRPYSAQLLTDDSDYCGVDGILLFTGNQRVVEAARAAGRLVAR